MPLSTFRRGRYGLWFRQRKGTGYHDRQACLNGTAHRRRNYYDKDALEERLIYDFDWKIGDTYRLAADEPYITITGIKYVEVNGKRKAFFATLNGDTSEVFLPLKGLDSSATDRLRQA